MRHRADNYSVLHVILFNTCSPITWQREVAQTPKLAGGFSVSRVTLQISSRVKSSKVVVTIWINFVTERQPFHRNGKAYELQTWYTDESWRPAMTFCVDLRAGSILYYTKWQHLHIIYNTIRRKINSKTIIKPEKMTLTKNDKTVCKW